MILYLILIIAFCVVLFAITVKCVFVAVDFLTKPEGRSTPKETRSYIPNHYVTNPIISVTGLDQNPITEFSQLDYSTSIDCSKLVMNHEAYGVWIVD